ncbi:MAG: class I SAM-dependent methyltransferase [Smithellaceae bacterium]|nr:class I SAM-dependent methyltransferase [Smithellaceae bacterium]
MLIRNMASPFTAIEAFIYDWFVAPATNTMSSDLVNLLATTIRQNAKFLDVGCGGGQLAMSLAKLRPDLTITGVDLSPQQIARARARNVAAGLTVDFVEGSALNLPFETNSFAVVFSSASIKHWPDPLAGLKECWRVLKPGGKLLVFEIDKDVTAAEAAPFVTLWRIPSFARPIARMFFLHYVVGGSISVADAKVLLDKLAAPGGTVERIPNRLVWLMQAEKPV